jgi:hypothetical protein
MKGLIAVFAALAVLGLAFFLYRSPAGPPAEMTEAEIAQIEADVMAVAAEMKTASDNLDTDAVVASYDPSAMHGTDGTTYYPTYEDWAAHLRDLGGRFQERTSEWRNTRVDVLARDAAVFVGQYEVTGTQVSGDMTRVQVYMTLVMRNIEGVWKVVHQASTGRWIPIEEG